MLGTVSKYLYCVFGVFSHDGKFDAILDIFVSPVLHVSGDHLHRGDRSRGPGLFQGGSVSAGEINPTFHAFLVLSIRSPCSYICTYQSKISCFVNTI